MAALIFTPSREPFACAPRGRKSWPGYFPFVGDDIGRMDGIMSEGLAKLGIRVWPVGGMPCQWFPGTERMGAPKGGVFSTLNGGAATGRTGPAPHSRP
jgi:hypothetical protein